MTTSSTFALPRLFSAVVDRFADEGSGPGSPSDVVQSFGWREVARANTAKGRIVWTPGDEVGALGTVGSPKQPGRVTARPLATLAELATCTISAVDPTATENELAQYEVTRALFDAWFRAVYLAARGTFAIVSSEWLVDKTSRRFGNAIRVVFTLEGAILDAPMTSAPTDTAADVVSTVGETSDPTETIEANA